MALLQPEFDSGDILVVGDGNFSFSMCLAEALAEQRIHLFASSLDPWSSLEGDKAASENLRKLTSFGNVTVLHEVDGTNLGTKFGSRRFRRIIFNFPHVGGKSKISLARRLLEQFFQSAVGHIEADGGDICVSLCQGQGGTPADNPAREYCNTWQVVSQAAKAGLILNAVWPFHGEDYPHYCCAGFRGRLGQQFNTKGGLTHKFILGTPLGTIPHVQTFLGQHGALLGSQRKLQPLPVQHPVHLLKKKLDRFFNHSTGTSFQIIDLESQAKNTKSCGTGRVVQESLSHDMQHFYKEIHECLMKTQGSFSLMEIVVDHSKPTSRDNYPVSHNMAVVHVKDSDKEIDKELVGVLSDLKSGIFANVEVSVRQGCFEGYSSLLLGSQHRSPVERSADGTHMVQNGPNNADQCSCEPPDMQCIFCRLEAGYLGLHQEKCSTVHLDNLLDLNSASEFYHQDELLLSCGLWKESMAQKGECRSGWIIHINLDHVVRAVCEIPDARLLWSCEPKFLEHFTCPQANDRSSLGTFTPFSLYAPSYTHDISFWLTKVATEKNFFEAIFKTTQDCVANVIFRERYHDKEQDLVSYNYRMVYSRCDGPLTHLQAVEMQNLLRRYLISRGFGLK